MRTLTNKKKRKRLCTKQKNVYLPNGSTLKTCSANICVGNLLEFVTKANMRKSQHLIWRGDHEIISLLNIFIVFCFVKLSYILTKRTFNSLSQLVLARKTNIQSYLVKLKQKKLLFNLVHFWGAPKLKDSAFPFFLSLSLEKY